VIVGARIPKTVYVSNNPSRNDKIRIIVTQRIEVGIIHITVHEAQMEVDTIPILMSDSVGNRLHHAIIIPTAKQIECSPRVRITIFIKGVFQMILAPNVKDIFRINVIHLQITAQTHRILVRPLTTVLGHEQTEGTTLNVKVEVDRM
jgi:hypothetical protein